MQNQNFYFGFPSGLQVFDYIIDDIVIQTVEFDIQEHVVNEFILSLPQKLPG